ncbi:hypothetical protein [Thetidibacter halocola]|uniref:Leucine-rich repeat domain-containing protein n=1 Tax=Thetidibacter halocola TaxID=2827239 RepID=A0A8J7WCN4_9RHOB|nr:hypothetical protein [Thetidibacter halocola]MBS0125150.1 hypothetical protein [Thetidibacter halocola]
MASNDEHQLRQSNSAGMAYSGASELIEFAKKSRQTTLNLSASNNAHWNLRVIPEQIAEFKSLESISLDGTFVTDLTPLQGLSALRALSFNKTGVTDLTPLQGLSALQWLTLEGTAVTDLTPLQGLSALRDLALDGCAALDLRP